MIGGHVLEEEIKFPVSAVSPYNNHQKCKYDYNVKCLKVLYSNEKCSSYCLMQCTRWNKIIEYFDLHVIRQFDLRYCLLLIFTGVFFMLLIRYASGTHVFVLSLGYCLVWKSGSTCKSHHWCSSRNLAEDKSSDDDQLIMVQTQDQYCSKCLSQAL